MTAHRTTDDGGANRKSRRRLPSTYSLSNTKLNFPPSRLPQILVQNSWTQERRPDIQLHALADIMRASADSSRHQLLADLEVPSLLMTILVCPMSRNNGHHCSIQADTDTALLFNQNGRMMDPMLEEDLKERQSEIDEVHVTSFSARSCRKCPRLKSGIAMLAVGKAEGEDARLPAEERTRPQVASTGTLICDISRCRSSHTTAPNVSKQRTKCTEFYAARTRSVKQSLIQKVCCQARDWVQWKADFGSLAVVAFG
eukprot:3709219-Rhodomonas_salina.9